jgi:uncharacterized protein YjiS (DUF1127 family)
MMTFSDTRYTAAAAPHTGASVRLGTLGLIWQWTSRLVLVDRRRQELHQLPDRVLEDIGLCRSDIYGITANLSDGLADVTCHACGP